MLTVFKGNASWIWETFDNQTINNILAEHNELMRDPKDKERERQEEEMQESLDYQMENNDVVKQFMSKF